MKSMVVDNPDEAIGEIVGGRWGDKSSVAGTEFTLVATDLAGRVSAGIPLEQRGAHFNLIDAELRHGLGPTAAHRLSELPGRPRSAHGRIVSGRGDRDSSSLALLLRKRIRCVTVELEAKTIVLTMTPPHGPAAPGWPS